LKDHWRIWACSWSLEWLVDHYSNESDRNEFLLENQIKLVDLLKQIEDESWFYLSDQRSVAFHDSLDRKIVVETKYRTCWISLISELSCSIFYESWLSYSSHQTIKLTFSKNLRRFYKDWHNHVYV